MVRVLGARSCWNVVAKLYTTHFAPSIEFHTMCIWQLKAKRVYQGLRKPNLMTSQTRRYFPLSINNRS